MFKRLVVALVGALAITTVMAGAAYAQPAGVTAANTGPGAVQAVGDSATDGILADERCDFFEGFLCIRVSGNRGDLIFAGVKYTKTEGPQRFGNFCNKTPSSDWSCGDPFVLNAGAA